MSTRTFAPQIARLVTDGEKFWMVAFAGDGRYPAAWLDEDGTLHTAHRKTASGAIKLAQKSWGR